MVLNKYYKYTLPKCNVTQYGYIFYIVYLSLLIKIYDASGRRVPVTGPIGRHRRCETPAVADLSLGSDPLQKSAAAAYAGEPLQQPVSLPDRGPITDPGERLPAPLDEVVVVAVGACDQVPGVVVRPEVGVIVDEHQPERNRLR